MRNALKVNEPSGIRAWKLFQHKHELRLRRDAIRVSYPARLLLPQTGEAAYLRGTDVGILDHAARRLQWPVWGSCGAARPT